MAKLYGRIYKDPKDGKEYFVIEDEHKQSADDNSHLVVITSRNSVILREREGRIKTQSGHEHSGYRDERISTFKGPDAPIHAVRYLKQKFNITDQMIQEVQ